MDYDPLGVIEMSGISSIRPTELSLYRRQGDLVSAPEQMSRTSDPEGESKQLEEAIRAKLARLGVSVNVNVIQSSSQTTGQIIDILV